MAYQDYVMCRLICDGCGRELLDDGDILFPSYDDADEYAQDHGWKVAERHGRHYCTKCRSMTHDNQI